MDSVLAKIYEFIDRVLLRSDLRAFCTCTAILSVGLVFSFLGCDLAFQRSGAVLVAFAIACLYLNHIVSDQLRLSELIYENRNNQTLDNLRKTLVNRFGEGEVTERVISGSTDDQRSMQKRLKAKLLRLQFVEFAAAFIGTLVWGFGDIPFA